MAMLVCIFQYGWDEAALRPLESAFPHATLHPNHIGTDDRDYCQYRHSPWKFLKLVDDI
jgi:hypothetical protein